MLTQDIGAEVIKFSSLFDNELTLDNLSRQQLQALCRLLQVPAFGTNAMLTFQLRMKLRSLRADDILISQEGVQSLTDRELQAAVQARGMRAIGLTRPQLEQQLEQWLHLHLKANVPSSLLLLSHAMYLPDTTAPEEKLGATLKSLSRDVVEEATVSVAETLGETHAVSNKSRLELLRREQERIKLERAMEEKQKASAPQATPAPAPGKAATADAAPAAAVPAAPTVASAVSPPAGAAPASVATPAAAAPAIAGSTITHEELAQLGEALLTLRESSSPVSAELAELAELRQERETYKTDLQKLREAAADLRRSIKESTGSARLGQRIDKMTERLQKELQTVEAELAKLRDARSTAPPAIDINHDGKIGVDEVMRAIQLLRSAPDQRKTRELIQFMDRDKDGEVSIEEIMKVVDLLEEEDADVTPQQVSEILSLLAKEKAIDASRKRASIVKDVTIGVLQHGRKGSAPNAPPSAAHGSAEGGSKQR